MRARHHLSVAALAVVLLSGCAPDGEVTAPPAVPSATIESPDVRATPTEPAATDGASINPEDFGGFPPAEILPPMFLGTGGRVPLPESLGTYRQIPGAVWVDEGRSQGSYEAEDGRQFTFVVHMNFGSYKAMMDRVENHRPVGISVCGESESGYVNCAAATEDADLTISPDQGSEFTAEEFDGILGQFLDWYRDNV